MIIKEFINEVRHTLIKVQEGIQTTNFEEIYQGIHYLKSSLDYLGTDVLLDQRQKIEKASNEKDMEIINKEYPLFKQNLVSLEKLYKNYLEKTG